MINLTATSSSSYNAQLVISDSTQESSIEKAASANITITSIDGDGVTVSLSESSQNYFHQSKVQAPEFIAPIQPPQEQSPIQTAQNIIEPIWEKLSEASEAGADRKELRGLIRDAYRGFRQGFREAVKTIDHSGNMDPELRHELSETKQWVRLGFKELRQEFLPKRQVDAPLIANSVDTQVTGSQAPESSAIAVEDTTTTTTADPLTNNSPAAPSTEVKKEPEAISTSNAPAPAVSEADEKSADVQSAEKPTTEHSPNNNPGTSINQSSRFSQSLATANRNAYSELQSLAQSVSASYDRSQSAVIEITTQDGDTISIDIASAIKASKTISGSGDFNFSLAGQNSDSFVIEGELDAGELEALKSILDQVDELATKFFNGDVAAAFEEAMNIGLDPKEIASFSLALNQSTAIEASRAYLENDGSDNANDQLQKQSRLMSLGDYVADMQKAMETASKFSNAANMVEKLLEKEALLHHDHQPQERRELFNQLNENILGNFNP